MELQFKLLLHAFQNSFIANHWIFNVHNNFMCKRQEHVICCVPYPTELSHMLVTCYTFIQRITQLYAQVFLTSYASHSSHSIMCCTVSSLHWKTRVSSQLHNARHAILITWWHNLFVPVYTLIYRNKANIFVKKENNTYNSENNFLMEVPHINKTHETFMFYVHNKFSENKSMYW